MKITTKQNIVLYIIIVVILSGLSLFLHYIIPQAGSYDVSFPQLAPFFAVLIIIGVNKDKEIFFTIKNNLKVNFKSIIYVILSTVGLLAIFTLTGYVLEKFGYYFTQWKHPQFFLV